MQTRSRAKPPGRTESTALA